MPAFHDESKVLHGIGHVELRPIESGLYERMVQHLTGWSNKRFASKIFLISGLLTYYHDTRAWRPAPEDGLSRREMQIAARAHRGGLIEIR
jgi:hypothetical protein